jgi:hypothetical protein
MEITVLLPLPDGPTNATVLPFPAVKLRPLSTGFFDLIGYAKNTELNVISPEIS